MNNTYIIILIFKFPLLSYIYHISNTNSYFNHLVFQLAITYLYTYMYCILFYSIFLSTRTNNNNSKLISFFFSSINLRQTTQHYSTSNSYILYSSDIMIIPKSQ
eukprot:UN00997